MNKKKYTSKLGLMLLLSIVVFIVIASAMLLTFLILYLLTKLGAMSVDTGDVGLLGIMEFMFCSCLIISLILTNSMGSAIFLKPVNRIITQLNRLADGDFSARLHFGKPIGEYPTFKNVEKSFNRAAEELEHTEMLRSDFINNFSHEFKTPIVSILGFAKLLKEGNLSSSQKMEYLSIIEEESMRLTRMADNIMTLTRVENLTILTNVSLFNLSEEIRASILLVEEKWALKDLLIDMEESEYMIEANEEILKHVWINLIDNAIKFSPEGGTISIRINEDENYLTVSISNSANDIPQEKIDRIFNKFYQADESHSMEGNGIGLAVVKRICTLHSGSVSVVSKDGTTTFSVLLPKKQKA